MSCGAGEGSAGSAASAANRTSEADVTFERDVADEVSQADAEDWKLHATKFVDGKPQVDFLYESWQSHWLFFGAPIGRRAGLHLSCKLRKKSEVEAKMAGLVVWRGMKKFSAIFSR
jgi:hypothetical protein